MLIYNDLFNRILNDLLTKLKQKQYFLLKNLVVWIYLSKFAHKQLKTMRLLSNIYIDSYVSEMMQSSMSMSMRMCR